ncbi:hypothetical protein Tco_0798008 [Tanacetum coccineum]
MLVVTVTAEMGWRWWYAGDGGGGRGDDGGSGVVQMVGEALRWHLEKIHVTWAHLEKKWTRLRLYTIYLEELCSQRVETASQVPSDGVITSKATASEHSRHKETLEDSR